MSEESSKRVAFIVGAKTGKELKATSRDTSRMHDLLLNPKLGGCCPELSPDPLSRCDNNSTLENALLDVLEDWDINNQFIFYFTGHGGTKKEIYYLKLGDKNKYIFDNLLNQLKLNGVKRAILILDACFSGAATKGEHSYTENPLPEGIAIIASSKERQKSREIENSVASVFTELFCTGIETGLDNTISTPNISVEQLVTYINNKINRSNEYQQYGQTANLDTKNTETAIWIAKNIFYKERSKKEEPPQNITNITHSGVELEILSKSTPLIEHPCKSESIFNHFNLTLLNKYAKNLLPDTNYDEADTVEALLSKCNLYSPIQYNNIKMPHQAAILCFCDNPEIFYPSESYSKFLIGKKSSASFSVKKIKGTLSHQIKQLVSLVEQNLNSILSFGTNSSINDNSDNTYRKEKLEIDIELIRELISNAIVHRDYSVPTQVFVHITPDALEITSPGVFPNNLTWEQLLENDCDSIAVNPKISFYLNELLVFEGVGRGFNIIRNYININGKDSITCSGAEQGKIKIRVLRNNKVHTIFSIPLQYPPRADYFIGRSEQLKKLINDLQPRQVVTICGAGGMGKTALAAEAVYSLIGENNKPPAHFPDGILFHSFYTQPSVDKALSNIALAYSIELKDSVEQSAQEALNGKTALLVLDGVEEIDDLSRILNITGNCGVFITSRNKQDAQAIRYDLSPFTQADAVELLYNWAEDQIDDQHIAKQICELIDGFPLAVKLIGRYLNQTGNSAAEYLQWLQETPLEALDPDEATHHHESVRILLDHSMKQVSQINEASLHGLAIFAYLSIKSVHITVLAGAFNLSQGKAKKLIKPLIDFGLLQQLKDHHYIVTHPLIHIYAKEVLTRSLSSLIVIRLTTWYTEFVIKESKEKPIDCIDYKILDSHRIHILSLIENLQQHHDWSVLAYLIGLIKAIDSYLDKQGYWQERKQILYWGLEAIKTIKQSENKVCFLSALGSVYLNLGDLDKAIECHQQVLDMAKRSDNKIIISNQLGNLGIAYAGLNELDKAIAYHQDALTIAEEISDQQQKGNHLGNLGSTYYQLEELDKSIAYYQKALEISQEIGDQQGQGNHLANLGVAYKTLGKLNNAMNYYQQSLFIFQDLSDKQGEANILNNIGVIYKKQGDFSSAQSYYQEALTLFEAMKSPSAKLVRKNLNRLERISSLFPKVNQLNKVQ